MLGNYRLTDIITEWLGGGALIKGPLQHICRFLACLKERRTALQQRPIHMRSQKAFQGTNEDLGAGLGKA